MTMVLAFGNVDAVFDDGRTDQHVDAAMVEIRHDVAELAFRHLAVADADARLGRQLGDLVGGALDGAHLVVHVEDLSAAGEFAGDGLGDHRAPLLHDERLDGQAPSRRRRDD